MAFFLAGTLYRRALSQLCFKHNTVCENGKRDDLIRTAKIKISLSKNKFNGSNSTNISTFQIRSAELNSFIL